MFGDVFFETIRILKGEVVLFLEFRFYINIDMGERLAATCFANDFSGSTFFTRAQLQVQEVEIHSILEVEVLSNMEKTTLFAENSGDITSQLDEMLWRILSKVASFLF